MIRGVEERIDGNAPGASNAALKKVCVEFESLFLSYMLKSFRASAAEMGPEEKSHGRQIYTAMLDEKLADQLALGGGIGLANKLLNDLQSKKVSLSKGALNRYESHGV